MGLHHVTQRKNPSSKNGSSNSSSHRNDNGSATGGTDGLAQESTIRQDIATFENWAASDDARGPLVAETATSAAACANRDAYAEMAQAEREGKRLPPSGAASRPSHSNGKAARKPKDAPEISPGLAPLPGDGASFVEAVHERVDLIELEVSLLKSEDEKIRQRELAYLRELKYGKIAAFSPTMTSARSPSASHSTRWIPSLPILTEVTRGNPKRPLRRSGFQKNWRTYHFREESAFSSIPARSRSLTRKRRAFGMTREETA
jgi:hypothetical protein